MKLFQVRIQNYRSIIDSNWFRIEPLTVLVGVNEAGKSNTLSALESFSSEDPYSSETDAPRAYDSDPSPEDPVVTVRFRLDEDDLQALESAGYEPAKDAILTVTKKWDGTYAWELPDIPAKRRRSLLESQSDHTVELLNRTRQRIRKGLEDRNTKQASNMMQKFNRRRPSSSSASEFETYVTEQCKVMRPALKILTISEARSKKLALDIDAVEESLRDCFTYPDPPDTVEEVLAPRLPRFRYFSDFAEVDGNVNLKTYIDYRDDPESVTAQSLDGEDWTARFKTIENLFDLLSVEPDKIVNSNLSTRRVYANRINRRADEIICRGWSQDIKIYVTFDSDHAIIEVADVIDGDEQAPTELRQRSKGFKSFLSFFVNCQGGLKGELVNTVLLLDEPGLHLHADQQREMISILEETSDSNTTIYTSHSPWMLPEGALHTIKTVEKTSEQATVVGERWWASGSNTAITIRKALGISQPHELVFPGCRYAIAVEGPADVIYLQLAADELSTKSKRYLSRTEFCIRPAQGAPELPTRVALFKSEDFEDVVMQVDHDQGGTEAENQVLRQGLLDPEKIVSLRQVVGDPRKEAEIEDLIDATDLLQVTNDLIQSISGVRSRSKITKKEFGNARRESKSSTVWDTLQPLADLRLPAGRTLSKLKVAEHFYRMWAEGTLSLSERTSRNFKRLLECLHAAFDSDVASDLE